MYFVPSFITRLFFWRKWIEWGLREIETGWEKGYKLSAARWTRLESDFSPTNRWWVPCLTVGSGSLLPPASFHTVVLPLFSQSFYFRSAEITDSGLSVRNSGPQFSFEFREHKNLGELPRQSMSWSLWTQGSESHSVISNSLQSHGLYSPWNSPGQNTASW